MLPQRHQISVGDINYYHTHTHTDASESLQNEGLYRLKTCTLSATSENLNKLAKSCLLGCVLYKRTSHRYIIDICFTFNMCLLINIVTCCATCHCIAFFVVLWDYFA